MPIGREKEKLVVGEKALEKPTLCSWIETARELLDVYPFFIAEVEKRLEKPIKGITVPLELYEDLKNVKSKLTKFLEKRKEEGKPIEVFPQGVVILKAYAEEGKIPKEKRYLILDGGFKTLNTAIANSEEVFWKRSFYDELGIKNLLINIFREELKKKNPEVTTNPQVLKTYFLEEKMRVGLKEIPVKKEKEKSVRKFIKMMFERLLKELESSETPFEGILIAGGLSYYLKPETFKTEKEVKVADEREFANAVAVAKIVKGPSLDLGFGDAKVVEP